MDETSRRLLERFESCELTPEAFHHRHHVRLAWACLRSDPPAAAIGRFSAALARYAAHIGQPGRYHETLTWAFMLLMRERIAATRECGWEAFAGTQPDLFHWPGGPLSDYYSRERLESPEARTGFLMPDRAPGYNAPDK